MGLVQIIDEHAGILRLEVTSVMGDNLTILKSDDVTTQRQVVGLHLVTDRGSLQRTASLVHLVEVVAQDGCVGHLRARREPFGNGDETTSATSLGQTVHIFRTGIL